MGNLTLSLSNRSLDILGIRDVIVSRPNYPMK